MELKRASKVGAPLKIGASGPSGSGKTMGALYLAKGIMGSMDKVAMLDTENKSGTFYCDLFGEPSYFHVSMQPPFAPDRFVKSIKWFEQQGIECLIIDSATHEWDGVGGMLEIHSDLAKITPGGSFPAWEAAGKIHRRFVDAILQSPMHIITTTRKKQDYVLEKNAKGKQAPKKVGLKEIQREGFEYELTVAFDVDISHLTLTSKDRTNLFNSDVPFMLTEEVGKKIKAWNEGTKYEQG